MDAAINRCKRDSMPLTRKLGHLELTYHNCNQEGSDLLTSVVHLTAAYKPTINQIVEALLCLSKRHPLLRMTIQQDPKTPGIFYFKEMDSLQVDFKEEQISPRDFLDKGATTGYRMSEGPLWRCRLIGWHSSYSTNVSEISKKEQVADEPKHPVFGFSWHHGIVDGIYFRWLVEEFLLFLERTNYGLVHKSVQSLSLYPPLDRVISEFIASRVPVEVFGVTCVSGNQIKASDHSLLVSALDAYVSTFANEIQSLEKREPKSRTLMRTFNENKTSTFISRCKDMNILLSGALMAACCCAFARLVEISVPSQCELELTAEILVNMRRYLPKDTQSQMGDIPYPGTGAFAATENVTVKPLRGLCPSNEFWKLAKMWSDRIKVNLKSHQYIKQMMSEMTNTNTNSPLQKGKAQGVVCLSNVGNLDVVLQTESSKDFRLIDMCGTSSVLIDDNPIFFLTSSTCTGKMTTCLTFCENYTTKATASRYLGYVESYIDSVSKL
ncbi:hypothetical protein CHS0354_038380 [Potamilus streckersoni]|uniref:Condensation domain-containing protein n=1 Tax=Potamilus streckersoni TaxID=2493646 RepID=A0AAE0S606_9BIVA|nr:hypothetical protein CHS0354_038380 [Potamilus streckersoni]